MIFNKTVKKGAFRIHYSIVDYGHGKEKRVSIKAPGLDKVLTDRSKRKTFKQMEASLLEKYRQMTKPKL